MARGRRSLTFSAPHGVVFDLLASLNRAGELQLGPGRATWVVDTYWDTPSRRLGQAGAWLRVRRLRGRVVSTVGLASSKAGQRSEQTLEVRADLPWPHWPEGPAKEKVSVLVGEEPLEVVASVMQRRVRRPATLHGQRVAWLNLDRVLLQRGGSVSLVWEVEVEQVGGRRDQARALASWLQAQCGLEVQPLSRLDQALCMAEKPLLAQEDVARFQGMGARGDAAGRRARGLLLMHGGVPFAEAAREAGVGHASLAFALLSLLEARGSGPRGARREGLTLDLGITEAGEQVVAGQLKRLLAHWEGAREGTDPEEVHDMRVATRRLRAALMVFSSVWDEGLVRKARKRLRSLGRRLGAVRDLDVFWMKTEAYMAGLDPAAQAQFEELRQVWEASYRRAREKLVAFLEGTKFDLAVRACRAVLTEGGDRKDTSGPLLEHVLPVMLFGPAADVRAFERDGVGPSTPLPTLHRLRVKAKALRYTLEFLSDVLGEEAKALIRDLRRLQDHLGALQDGVVAVDLLERYLARGTWEARHRAPGAVTSPAIEEYLAARRREVEELRAKVAECWNPVGGRILFARLAHTIPGLGGR